MDEDAIGSSKKEIILGKAASKSLLLSSTETFCAEKYF